MRNYEYKIRIYDAKLSRNYVRGGVTQGQSGRFACDKSQVRFLPPPIIFLCACEFYIFLLLQRQYKQQLLILL
jgi:hypothetical protein